MRKKFLLYITDEDITLYKETSEKPYALKGNFEDVQPKLKTILSSYPKAPLWLVIDRNHQDIREEKLPPLFVWDRIRLLFHKKAEWAAHGGYAGFQFLKEEGKTYLRWAHIPPSDSLTPWLLWAQSLPNPFGGVSFVPLEAKNFIKKHLPAGNHYQMLLYNLPSQKMRYVVFKGSRLLLSRFSRTEENLKSSLHFLSRTYPDIHEELRILSLVKESFTTFPHITALHNPQALIDFLVSQKRPSFVIQSNTSSKNLWLRRGAGTILISVLILAGVESYQGFKFKNNALNILPEIASLHVQTKRLNLFLQDKNVPPMRTAVEHY